MNRQKIFADPDKLKQSINFLVHCKEESEKNESVVAFENANIFLKDVIMHKLDFYLDKCDYKNNCILNFLEKTLISFSE